MSRQYRYLFASAITAACSSSSAATEPPTDAGLSDVMFDARFDSSRGVDAESEGGQDSSINAALFEFSLEGKPATPTSIVFRKHGVLGLSGVKGEVEGRFELPKGPLDTLTAPYITLDVYTPLLGAVPYSPVGSTSQPNTAYVQYHYERPGTVGFPKAVGGGMEILRDGRDGWFEANCSGTFNIDGAEQSFTLRIRREVAAMP